MKNRKGTMKRALTVLIASASLLKCHAAVPMPPWTVDTARAQPAQFEAYQGETLTFEAALTCRGKPIEAPSNYSFFWQTNGMGRYYWEAPAKGEAASSPLVGTNVIFATWLPAYDCGAKVYNCFIGSPSNNYHAAFQLRLRPSPGALPNVLPLPVPVIDFAKVRVLNPPWESGGGGGGGGVNTNAVIDIIHATVDGAARQLPKYLHALYFADSYPAEAAEYYRSRGNGKVDGGCSSVRDGGFLSRNFDYPFDERAEFVVKMSAGPNRFASVGVAQVGTNLTEQIVTSGKWSKWYKALPGATVDGINENGVACNINIVDGDPQTSGWHTNATSEAIHPLGAIRWILDHATNAQQAATYIAANIRFPQGWTQNFHYMVCDQTADAAWIVENGHAYNAFDYFTGLEPKVMTNFTISDYPWHGEGIERFNLLLGGANITNAWYTRAYRRETNPPWVSDLADVIAYTNEIFDAWATHPKEYFRNKTTNGEPWWQTVHTSVYDITNNTLRVAVQETDDWYVFQVPSSGAKVDAYTKAETDAKLAGKVGLRDGVIGTDGHYVTANEMLYNGDDPYGMRVADKINDLDNYKANKRSDAEPGHLASFDSIGDMEDSGIAADDVARLGEPVEFSEVTTGLFASKEAVIGEYGTFVRVEEGSVTAPVDVRVEDVGEVHSLRAKADRSMISATDPTFSNAVMGVASHTDAAFAAEVLAVQVASLSTNITAEVYIAATNACANLGIDPSLIPQGGTLGTVGGLLVALAAAVALLRKKTSLLKSDGTAEDDFATNLLGKPVAKTALMIPLEAKTNSFTAEDGHAYAVTMTGTVTITMPITTEGKAAIFQARFSAAAQQSVEFSTTDLVKFDGTDCGIVKAGKDALLSAMWNGEAWDLVWKNQA